MVMNNVTVVVDVSRIVQKKHEEVVILKILRMSVLMEITHQATTTIRVANDQNTMLLLYQNPLVKPVSTLMHNT